MAATANALVDARAAALAAAFRDIEVTRMSGVPILNPRLSVQSVGFEPDCDVPWLALGVLVTPWFINLVRLPLVDIGESALAAIGESRTRGAGALRAEFIGAHEPAVGRFEACSLFSPVLEFADQAAALATATEVLRQLREPPPIEAPAARPSAPLTPAPTATVPDRRAFLFGRRSPASGA
ncbi:MAG: [NiFe]-hydrogenase assembly chaperone HybE [Pseudomonadota bacterium]